MSYDYHSGYEGDPYSIDAVKSDQSIEDFRIIWVLGGDTILTSVWSCEYLIENSSSFTDTTATIWLSGGSAGQVATVTNTITTAQGRKFEKTLRIQIREL